MPIQYGYNSPVIQPTYGYSMMPAQSFAQAPVAMAPQPVMGRNSYMIQVDGEMAAKAWQTPPDMKPGDVIPLWDADGIHVYFKSLDGYGRLNPTRRARIIFEDEAPALPENTSGAVSRQETMPNPGQYASKEDLDMLRNDIAGIRQMLSANRQNGRNSGMNNAPMNKGGSETP